MTLTILTPGDNDEIKDNIAELLAINHYNVLIAENSRAGFEVKERKNPDLILCDMVMPETDGPGFLELLKNNESIQKIPIIFFQREHRYLLFKKLIKSADGFLRKPFLEEDIITSIENILA